MATLNRRPLATRSLQASSTLSPLKSHRTVSASKRPRSPEPPVDPSTSQPTTKRVKALDPSPASKARDQLRERKHLEREQQKAEFKEKYTRAFPAFTFYFDELNIGSVALDAYEERIEQLGAKIVKFLDKTVTHFISNRPDAAVAVPVDKENALKPGNTLQSPIKLKGRTAEETECGNAVAPSTTLSYKIWNTAKLESVLSRLLDSPVGSTSIGPAAARKQVPSLARLLKSEQIHGTTERDPTQRRHDFKYFNRGSKFVLVEDLRQEIATIIAYEYAAPKTRDGVTARPPWPVLHCHPQARGPFIAFDEKEKRRWEKLQKAEGEQKAERKEYSSRIRQAELVKRKAQANLRARRAGDLRRCVSMNNLHRTATFPDPPDDENLLGADGDGENLDSAIASGFLASGTAGYMAASGNSVGITSTTGTTSTTGYTTRALQLPSTLSGRMKHVVTSRKFPSAAADKENKAPLMGPPASIPERQPLLRKSRSTNTLKLPKREEGCKPGYCESCRTKFDDFRAHVAGRKHQRFATNDANFLQLDCVLARVHRRTKSEVLEARMKSEERRKNYCSNAHEGRGSPVDEPEFSSLVHHAIEYDAYEDIDMLGGSDRTSSTVALSTSHTYH
ncbi:putative zinc finger in DBF-like proteins [Lyophyllum shimeji]|uniref:Zinc finger in DBF-like proteins n=1 Tax=Lyophyllum shimeji TaxID=47721 RepID=A0A9P3PJS1_LYOSH|nr:putative zinc finger in DBF-like proteins [Lyophyllum shimeji]